LKTSNLAHTDFEIWASRFEKSFSITGKTSAFNFTYFENHIKAINILFGKKSDVFTFKACGIYCYHGLLRDFKQ